MLSGCGLAFANDVFQRNGLRKDATQLCRRLQRGASGKWDNPMMYFALFVLIVLCISAVAIWVFLAITPGRIADQRGHPRADAVRVCGDWGALTLGILMPLAFIWAYADGTSAPADRETGNRP